MKDIYDVVIVGGGVAGVSAALSAKKEGLDVVLIEKGSLLGGLATSGLINWYEPLCDGLGKQLIYGQAENFFELALKYGYSTLNPNWAKEGKRKSSWFDHNLFALSLNRLLTSNNIDIEYESQVNDVLIENEKLVGVVVNNVEGKRIIKAKTFIDGSGTAILFRLSNLKVRSGENYLTYATTIYKEIGKPKFQYSGANAFGKNHPLGMKTFNGLIQEDVNEFLIKGQELALKEYEEGKLKEISTLPSMPQFRKVASIDGKYILNNKDKNIYHYDSIGVIGVFYKPSEYYEIPLGTLYNSKMPNLYACGRIISSDEDAWEAIRVIPAGILTGEVCGILAKQFINNKFNLEDIQNKLINRNIKLHY